MGTQVEIAGYRIKDELGRGGMATVYLAVQESVLREVALKVMSPVLRADPSFGERFMREARIAANLHHRNVVGIHDVGIDGDFHYIAMEHLSGGDIKARFRSGMSLSACLRVTSEIAAALDYAHAKGFVHRDIKPDNILFREDGSAVLTDFGIARATDSSTQMTRTGAVVGTPHYMSPEQARGKPLDHRSDLYSLGIVFFEMATGRLPYEAGDSLAVGIKHITEPIPHLPSRLSAMQPFLKKILAKDREQRYQTGAAIAEDLRKIMADVRDELEQPLIIDAPPPPKSKRARRTVVLDRPKTGGRREPNLGAIDSLDPELATAGDYRKSRGWQAGLVGISVIAVLTAVAASIWFVPGADGWAQSRWRNWQASAMVDRATQVSEDKARAAALYREALALDPTHRGAREGIKNLEEMQRADEVPDAGNTASNAADAATQSGVIEREETDVLVDLVNDSAPEPPVERSGANEQRISGLLALAQTAMEEGRLVGDRANTALTHLRAVQALDADNVAASRGIDAIALRLVELSAAAFERGNIERAERLLDEARVIVPGLSGVREMEARITGYRARNATVELTPDEQAVFDDLLYSADLALEAGQLMSPPGDSAYDFLKAALAMQRTNSDAEQGLLRLSRRLAGRAREALSKGQLEAARDYLLSARQADGSNPELAALADSIAAGLLTEVRAAIAATNLDRAEALLTDAGRLAPANTQLEDLALQIAIARD